MTFVDDQAIEAVTLNDGTVLTRCDQCKTMHGERNPPTTPPCDDCFVKLQDCNKEIAEVFMITRRQYITAGMGQPVDISIPAVKMVMDMKGMQDQYKNLSIIRRLFHHFLRRDNESC